jgi:hypothetical protein
MKLSAILLILVFAFTCGVACAIVCPEDTVESHENDCTQCTSPDFVVSAKSSDDHALATHAFSPESVDLANLSCRDNPVDRSTTLESPSPRRTGILTLRV